MGNIIEICQQFETDIRSGSLSTVIEYGRSAAQKSLMKAFRKEKTLLKNIGGYISKRTPHPNQEIEKSIREAWEMLLSDIALGQKFTHLDILTHWAQTHTSN